MNIDPQMLLGTKMSLTPEQLAKLQQVKALNTTLPLLKEGQTFKGQVLDIQGSKVLLELLSGEKVTAQLGEKVPMKIGTLLFFLVASKKGSQITLKPLSTPTVSESLIGDALKAAGLKLTDNNMNLMKALIQNKLPIDQDSLLQFANILNKEGMDLGKLLLLLKNNIPTKEGFIKTLEGFEDVNKGMTASVKEFKELLMNNTNRPEVKTALAKAFMELKSSDFNELLKELQLPEEVKDELVLLRQSGQLEAKTLVEGLFNEKAPSQGRKIMDFLINKLFSLDVTRKEGQTQLEGFYERLQGRLKTVGDALSQEHSSSSGQWDQGTENGLKALGEQVSTLTEQAQILERLSEQLQVMHIPLYFNNGLSGGNLFLLNEKEESEDSGTKKGVKTALLSLDLAYLGKLEAYIALTKEKEVWCNFRMMKGDVIPVIKKHLSKLSVALNKKGYKIGQVSVEPLEAPFEFIQQPLLDDTLEKQYSFDMRV